MNLVNVWPCYYRNLYHRHTPRRRRRLLLTKAHTILSPCTIYMYEKERFILPNGSIYVIFLLLLFMCVYCSIVWLAVAFSAARYCGYNVWMNMKKASNRICVCVCKHICLKNHVVVVPMTKTILIHFPSLPFSRSLFLLTSISSLLVSSSVLRLLLLMTALYSLNLYNISPWQKWNALTHTRTHAARQKEI